MKDSKRDKSLGQRMHLCGRRSVFLCFAVACRMHAHTSLFNGCPYSILACDLG